MSEQQLNHPPPPTSIRAADTKSDLIACWPLMRLLRPDLVLVEMFATQALRQRTDGYHLLVAWHGAEASALAGWRVQENLVHGRHLYVDDLVTQPERRGQGLGAQLLKMLAEEGRALGCAKLVLDTAVDNIAGQQFYVREGLRNTALRFSRLLVQP